MQLRSRILLQLSRHVKMFTSHPLCIPRNMDDLSPKIVTSCMDQTEPHDHETITDDLGDHDADELVHTTGAVDEEAELLEQLSLSVRLTHGYAAAVVPELPFEDYTVNFDTCRTNIGPDAPSVTLLLRNIYDDTQLILNAVSWERRVLSGLECTTYQA